MAARRADRLAVLSKELDGALAVPTDVTDQTHGPEQPGLDQVIA
jgi:NADP-dependent 3-hydroxy acid dehydrogenase YdfG